MDARRWSLRYNVDWDSVTAYSYEVHTSGPILEASLASESQPLRRAALSQPASGNLEAAIDAFHRAYFPHVDSQHWGLDHHRRVSGTGPEAAAEREELVTSRWPLVWYWKVLFHALAGWSRSDRKRWFFRISQIRHWVLAYLFCFDRNQPRLLRPPLFGPSERLLLPDSYFTLLDFRADIDARWDQIEKAPTTPGVEKHVARAQFLGRNDFTYRIDEVSGGRENGDVKVKLRAHLDLHPNVLIKGQDDARISTITKAPLDILPDEIVFPPDHTWIPSFGNPSTEEEVFPVLLRSSAVCRAFHAMSEVWNDPTAKSVVISAPPGSGKELLAKSVYEFRETKGAFRAFQLSATCAEENQRSLFYRDLRLKSVRKDVARLQEDRSGAARFESTDGLVFQARRGVLFLDEIDKVAETTRADLLRLLENDDAVLYGHPVVVPLRSEVPVYVFAGSKPKEEMSRLSPADFWTRISHLVTMDHPLGLSDPNDVSEVVEDYFHMFWIDHLFRVWRDPRVLPEAPKPLTDSYPALKPSRERSAGWFRALLDPSTVRFFARAFASELCEGREDVDFSIRKIRSVAQRTVFSVLEYLRWDRAHDSGIVGLEQYLSEERITGIDMGVVLRSALRVAKPVWAAEEKRLAPLLRKVEEDLRRCVADSLRLIPE